MNLKDKIAEYPNFPKKGILFRDFSPVLKDPSSLSYIADEFSKHFHPKDVDVFAGIESRGFLLATNWMPNWITTISSILKATSILL